MRLPSGSRSAPDPGRRRISLVVDGAAIEALDGETVAAALSAAGILRLRDTRTGRPRGLHCGMGACFDCLVTVDGRASTPACLEPVRDGMRISTAPPQLAEVAPLAAPDATVGEMPAETVDLLVIGAGPAGLTAAAIVAEAGARVLVADERPKPGGQYFKPLVGQDPSAPHPDRQYAEGAALTARAIAAGVRVLSGARVWSASTSDGVGLVHDGRAVVVRPRRLLLATGASERPLPLPGWTLPGVTTTGGLQTLVRSYRAMPGTRPTVAGNGPLNLQLACELVHLGVPPVAVVEAAAKPSAAKLTSALTMTAADPRATATGIGYLATLARAGVPVLWSHRPIRIEGDDRVEALVVVGPNGERRLETDLVALNHGFQPQAELARMLGCTTAWRNGAIAVETRTDGRTTLEQVFAVGDGAAIAGARVAQARAELAAASILADLGRPSPETGPASRRLASAERFQAALWALFAAAPPDPAGLPDATIVCRCEEVTAGRVREACRTAAPAMGAVKRMTRAGMGRCQGRFCAVTLARLVEAEGGPAPAADALFAPRPPARPVPLAAVALEKPEWAGHARAVPPAVSPRAVPPIAPFGEIVADVAVIGAGVVGACIARELARAGRSVVVLDRHEPNLQASGANAGSLHVQLLSFDFGVKATGRDRPAAETLAIARDAIGLWHGIQSETAADLEISTPGGLMVAETAEEIGFLEAKAALERRYGIDTRVVGTNELRSLEPHLSPSLIGAAYCADEGKINPATATYAVAALAQQAGARFETFAGVTSIDRDGAGWRLATERGTVRAGALVNCAGGWASRVAAMAGRPIPVSGAPLQMIVTEPGPPMVRHLIAHGSRHLSLKQADAGGLIIGGAWTAELDPATGASRTLRRSVEGNASVACRVLPPAAGLRIVRIWAGMNIDIDGAPIIGEMPGSPGFWNCVTSNGYSLAPMVARLTADLMLRGRSDWPTAPFTLDRFG